MIEHTLHRPSRISVGYIADRDRCPFCGAANFTPGRTCQCGVTCPSLASYQKPRPKRRKLPPSKLAIYEPQFRDGIADRDPQQPDELAPYRADLDHFHIPTDTPDERHDPDAWPETDNSDSVPW